MANKKKPRKQRLSALRFRLAAESTFGNVTMMAETLDVSRQTIYNRMKKYDDAKRVVESARNSIVDIASSQLMRHVHDPQDLNFKGDLQAIKFVLETWGKNQGWSKRTEITGADGQALFGVTLDDDVREYLVTAGIDEAEIMSYAAGQFNEMIREMMVEDASA